MTPTEVAAAQLAAYNARDIDAFCACYTDDVRVYDANGDLSLDGIAAFRASYATLFTTWDAMGAEVDDRQADGDVVVDRERWWRSRGDEHRGGRVRVTYTVRDGKIAEARFTSEVA